MIKSFIRIIVIIFGSLLLGGCWNYVGLNELTIVAGIGIDKVDNKYHLTFEIIDMITSNKTEGIRSKIIESEGNTVFEAARNAKKITSTKLNYSNTQVVIIGENVAKEDGLYSIISWFIKDAETRETINVGIAKDSSAKDIISQKGVTNSVNSFEMREIIQKDQVVTSSTKNTMLYQMYNDLNTDNQSLVLPAFRLEKEGETSYTQVDGIAIFKKDKLYKYLTGDESKYYLFIVDEVKGGVIPFSSKNDDKYDVTYEINKSSTKIGYKMKDKKLVFSIIVDVKGFLAEYDRKKVIQSDTDISKLQKIFSIQLKKKIENLFKDCQEKNYPDFFEFGKKIYATNQKLWKKVGKNWDDTFKKIEINVDTTVEIKNTAFTR